MRRERPIRVRTLIHGIGYWKIATLASFATWQAARAWLEKYPNEHFGAEFIEHRDAPATLDHVNLSPASR